MTSITFDNFKGGWNLAKPDQVQDANRFRELVNCHVTPGGSLKKRPGLRYVWSWGAGVRGLFSDGQQLVGFFGDLNPSQLPAVSSAVNWSAWNHQNYGPFQVKRLNSDTADHKAINLVTSATTFRGNWYVAALTNNGARNYYLDGLTEATDTPGHHGVSVLGKASKAWTIPYQSTSVLRFSKTGDAKNWTELDDAGFLDIGAQQNLVGGAVALAEFQEWLVVFSPTGAQLWKVDPDPSLMSYDKSTSGAGMRDFAQAVDSIGSDLLFLSHQGIRSLVLQAQHGNAMDSDVGAPIDKFVQEMGIPSGGYTYGTKQPIAKYLRSLGQWWLCYGKTVLVYTFSTTLKIYAWSRYEFPWEVEGVAETFGQYGGVWVRSLAGDIYHFEADYPFDDDAEQAALLGPRDPRRWGDVDLTGETGARGLAFPALGRKFINVIAGWPHIDFKSPALEKQVFGMDIVAKMETPTAGWIPPVVAPSYTLTHRYRSMTESVEARTDAVNLAEYPDDTRAEGWLPVDLMAATLAPRIVYSGPQSWELSAICYHYENLGAP